jgi:hypothetical protein
MELKEASNVLENVHDLIEHTHARYEVLPYYIIHEAPHGTTKRIQAGFDIEVYGLKPSQVQHPGREYVLGYIALQNLVATVLPEIAEACSVEVFAFPSTILLDPKAHFQEEGMLRIRLTHKELEPAGEQEERALKKIKERLQHLGLSQK